MIIKTRISYLAQILFLFVQLTSCKENESSELKVEEYPQYFPLEIGNSWSFEDTSNDIHLVSVQETEDINGQSYYKFLTFPFPFHEIPGVSGFNGDNARGWIREDSEGVYFRFILESNITTTPFEINIFRNEVRGTNWINEFTIDYKIGTTTISVPVIYNFEITDTYELLNINGTDYPNAVNVSFSTSLSYFDEPYVKELEGELIFVKGVGIVQSYIKSTANGTLMERNYSIVEYDLK